MTVADSAETARRPTAPTASPSPAVTGREEDLVAQQARLSDLTVVPHPEADEDVSSSDALHAVLFDSGRPVLIAPREAPADDRHPRLLAWNGTAESAAAVAAALPWLQRAEAVRCCTADEYQRRGPTAEDLPQLSALARHRRPRSTLFKPVDRDVGAGLLGAARDFGADLLAWAPTPIRRLRQLILGGVTRHVLENARLPVMMNR